MDLSYRLLKRIIPALNLRSHRETEFLRIARQLCIDVHELELDCFGCYVADPDGDLIFIDPRLRLYLRLETQLHELTHAILDYPCDFLKFRQQLHAEVFALVLMIPLRMLFEYEKMPFDLIDERLIPYLKRRKFIYERFGF